MSGKFRLKKSFGNFKKNRPEEVMEFSGHLGAVVNGQQVVSVAGRESYVWVRLRNDRSEVIQAFNDKVSEKAYDLPVLVTRKSGDKSRWMITGRNIGRYNNWGSSPYLPEHAESHEYSGNDVVFSDIKQIVPLSVYAEDALTVGVMPGHICTAVGTVQVDGTLITLSPPTGTVCYALIQANLTTGVVSVKYSSEFALEDLSDSKIPSADAGNLSLAAVRLHAGQTEITNRYDDPDIIDLRMYAGGAFTGASVAAQYMNYIIRYSAGTVYAYDPDAAGLTTALGAAIAGDTVVIPPYTFDSDYTVPDSVALIGWGNESLIWGKLTVGDETWIQSLKVENIANTTGTVVGIEGPDTTTALCYDVSVRAVNQGDGNAYAIQVGQAGMTVRLGTLRAEADGAGNSRNVFSDATGTITRLQSVALLGDTTLDDPAPANWQIAEGTLANLQGCFWHNDYDYSGDNIVLSDDGDRSPQDHTHPNPDYPGLDTVSLFHDNAVTVYAATTAGLVAALGAAVADDIVTIPPLDITGSISVPDYVTLSGHGNISRILGKVSLGYGSWLEEIKVYVVSSSSDPIIAIEGPPSGTAFGWYAYAYAANLGTGDAYCVNLNGGKVSLRNGTVRAEASDGGASARIFYKGTPSANQEAWLDYMAVLGSTYLTDAAAANFDIIEGEICGLSLLEWNDGYLPPTGTVLYADGDRSPINHNHDNDYAGISDIREKLAADRTYYVRTDGNDNNTGFSDTSGSAFLTIQHAVDTVATLDINAHIVTIQVGDGTYAENVTLKNVPGFAATGNLILQGNETTPTDVVVAPASGTCFFANGLSVVWTVKWFSVTVPSGGYGVRVNNNSSLIIGGMNFGVATGGYHIGITYGSILHISGDYTISGGATYHILMTNGSLLVFPTGSDRGVFTANCTFTTFMAASGLSGMRLGGWTVGAYTITGQKFDLSSLVQLGASSPTTVFPGSTAGTWTMGVTDITLSAGSIITDTTTGLIICTATTQKLGFFNATPVVQQTELTDELTTVTFTAPGTPDYAVGGGTSGGYGFSTADEFRSVMAVIANLQARVNQLETKLVAYGLLPDAD